MYNRGTNKQKKAKQMNLYDCRAIKQSIKEGIEKGLPWCDAEILAFYDKKEKELKQAIANEIQAQGITADDNLIEFVYNLHK